MASSQIKQHILLKTIDFGIQTLRFYFVDHNTIDVGTIVLNFHYLKERLDNQSFKILLDETKLIPEISIELKNKTIGGVLTLINKSVLQYRPFEDFYEQ